MDGDSKTDDRLKDNTAHTLTNTKVEDENASTPVFGQAATSFDSLGFSTGSEQLSTALHNDTNSLSADPHSAGDNQHSSPTTESNAETQRNSSSLNMDASSSQTQSVQGDGSGDGPENKQSSAGTPTGQPLSGKASSPGIVDGEGLMKVPETTKPQTEEKDGTPPRIRHTSGNPPGVRGIIIESRSSRDNSPSRGGSPYRSPGVSPGYNMGDRSFALPPIPPSGSRTKLPSSTSDYTLQSGGVDSGTRPKTTPRNTTAVRPSSEKPLGSGEPGEARRRYSSSNISTRRGNRQRLSTSESMPTVPGRSDRSTDLQPQQVAAQSEEIMQNYMYERYSRDTLQSEGDINVPRSPTMLENFTSRPQTKVSAVGRRLAAIGDEIDSRYSSEFREMTKSLNIEKGAIQEAYEAFRGVALRLFKKGLSMGRIVALLQFGYHLAIDVLRQGIGDFMAEIIGWLVRFITFERIQNFVSDTRQSIAEWIAGQGGWQAAVDSMTNIGDAMHDSAPYILSFLAASAFLAGTAYWFSRS